MQLCKTVYFSDYPTVSGTRSGLTIPFSHTDADFFRSVERLSSFSLREILGFQLYSDLEKAASLIDSPVATFARNILRESVPYGPASRTNDKASGLQATFRGGKGSPLHDWYPYLEGYSPDFVTSVFREFAQEARTILDPFCGSGTTALVAALDGREGWYSEVNPVCRFIIEAKAAALTLDDRERHRLASRLGDMAASLAGNLRRYAPDEGLRLAFGRTFGNRPFFDAKTFETVLRLRSLLDALIADDANAGQFLTVAVLRSLVPGSLLIRRGDLRFRTDSELSKVRPDFISELCTSIDVIASDLLDLEQASGSVTLVCDDARKLSKSVTAPVDAVITSPPYLNGTNYFRNTKIELWFLRYLSDKSGLRSYRDQAITAGINDVTLGKSEPAEGCLPSAVMDVVSALDRNAYDQRIPLMVRSYFYEMQTVIGQLRKVCHAGTTVSIDLGDSCYGDVWVPTHDLLCLLMEAEGFKKIENVVLRERQSRDGRKLSQTLQVFRLPASSRAGKRRKVAEKTDPSPSWQRERWGVFRDTLPHQQGDMAKRNWGHAWHSLCSYQGKLKPSIAHTLVHALMPEGGGKLLDPFSGVGTIPFEARQMKHVAYGFDISPAAIIISRAKLEPANERAVKATMTKLARWIEAHRKDVSGDPALNAIRFNGPLPSYFHPDTFAEIAAARAFFQKNPADTGSKALVLASLLHVLHGNRPYALSRRSHPITPFAPTGPTEYRSLMNRLAAKVERSLADLASIAPIAGRSFFQDATANWPVEVADLDAVITSPPFFDSTRFHTANWMRLWFAGWNLPDFASKPSTFVDERQKKGFSVYDSIFKQSAERLKADGYLAIHLGKSPKCDMAAALTEVGKQYLVLEDVFAESVDHCESHGIRDKGTVTHHQYLLFRKPRAL